MMAPPFVTVTWHREDWLIGLHCAKFIDADQTELPKAIVIAA
jgi:hypothetical protein